MGVLPVGYGGAASPTVRKLRRLAACCGAHPSCSGKVQQSKAKQSNMQGSIHNSTDSRNTVTVSCTHDPKQTCRCTCRSDDPLQFVIAAATALWLR